VQKSGYSRHHSQNHQNPEGALTKTRCSRDREMKFWNLWSRCKYRVTPVTAR
jgi:hypothetical protein